MLQTCRRLLLNKSAQYLLGDRFDSAAIVSIVPSGTKKRGVSTIKSGVNSLLCSPLVFCRLFPLLRGMALVLFPLHKLPCTCSFRELRSLPDRKPKKKVDSQSACLGNRNHVSCGQSQDRELPTNFQFQYLIGRSRVKKSEGTKICPPQPNCMTGTTGTLGNVAAPNPWNGTSMTIGA